MDDGESLFVKKWRAIAGDLNLEIVTPFELSLPSGTRVRVPVLLKQFGARGGMLLVTDFSLIRSSEEEIIEAGYGYSTLSAPRSENDYDRHVIVDVLADWGWSGPEAGRPDWLPAEAPDAE